MKFPVIKNFSFSSAGNWETNCNNKLNANTRLKTNPLKSLRIAIKIVFGPQLEPGIFSTYSTYFLYFVFSHCTG